MRIVDNRSYPFFFVFVFIFKIMKATPKHCKPLEV